MRPIKPQPGSASDPSSFVGRVEPTRLARQWLNDGQNLIVADPRRMGKTQWMRHLARTATEFTCVVIDYEGTQTAAEFLTRTAGELARTDQLPGKFRTTMKTWFQGVDEVNLGFVTLHPNMTGKSPTDILGQLVKNLDRTAAGSQPVLVLMDEVPLAIRNIVRNESPEAARLVLQVLRQLRQGSSNVRWVVCGSIGFHHVLTSCGATEGDLNDLTNLPLGALTTDEATELGHRLLLGIGCANPTQEAVQALAEECGRIPFLMHKIASTLTPDAVMTESRIRVAFLDFLDDRDDSRAVTHFLTRLDDNYSPHTTLARKTLDLLASDRAALSPKDLRIHPELAGLDLTEFDIVLDLLTDDHYLVKTRGKLSWKYDVLRRIWAHRRDLETS